MISVTAAKSGSNWLDRLRSSRGFPTGEDADLDHFLSASCSSASAPAAHCPSTHFQPPLRDYTGIGEVSNVLSDLFKMGECSRAIPKMKVYRKQPNPRLVRGTTATDNELCSSDDLKREKGDNGLASSGDNSLNDSRESADFIDGSRSVEDGENVDLRGYTRSEVMVIDTSFTDWKFDGWVFRKNDEWNIKEKKSKVRVFGGKKKRKVLMSAVVDEKSDEDQQKRKNNKDEDNFLPFTKHLLFHAGTA